MNGRTPTLPIFCPLFCHKKQTAPPRLLATFTAKLFLNCENMAESHPADSSSSPSSVVPLTWRKLSSEPCSEQTSDQTWPGEAQQPTTTLANCKTFLLDRQGAEPLLKHEWTFQTQLTGLAPMTNQQTAVLHVIVELQKRALSKTEVDRKAKASSLHKSVHAYFSQSGHTLSDFRDSYERLLHSLPSLTLYANGFDKGSTSIGDILQDPRFEAHLDVRVPTSGPVRGDIALRDMVIENVASLHDIPCRASVVTNQRLQRTDDNRASIVTDRSTDDVDMLATLELQFGLPPVSFNAYSAQ